MNKTIQEIIKESKNHLKEFAELYDSRPIYDNSGGMKTPHMFWAWLITKLMQPEIIVESGVFLGQGTWFFRKACPDAGIICIDPALNNIRIKYDSNFYTKTDFSQINWEEIHNEWRPINKDKTLLFFDDHQNALERVRKSQKLGFSHLMFEDNYPVSQGDCYSLKKAFSCSGLPLKNIEPNTSDKTYLSEILQQYLELPPIFTADNTRWGDAWSASEYPTVKPLLTEVKEQYEQLYFDEAMEYTWICYAELKK